MLKSLAAVFLLVIACSGCSLDRMRQCDDNLKRNIQRRVNDVSRSDMTAHCSTVREDFNCLLAETRCSTSDDERSRNGDTLRNALKYLRDGCDTSGRGTSWRDSTCFVSESMKTCESSYPLGGSQYGSYNPETCRKYNQFYDCVMDTIRNRCRQDDERMLGQYLVDSANDLAWNCGDRDSRDRQSDRYYNDRERDYNSNRNGNNRDYNREDRDRTDRDRYDRDRYDRDRTSNTRYGGGSGYNSDVSCCQNERCGGNRMRECRDSLSRTIDNRISGYQDSNKCRRTRDDFNCLMWHTSNCASREERDRDNDIFRRARDYISRNCDTYGRWSENSCYKTQEMQRCESQLSNTRGGANYESCRSFLQFRDCMQDELRRCTREDELFQGAYLSDKAMEMSWQCGSDTQYGRGGGGYNSDRRYQGNRQQDGSYNDGYGNNGYEGDVNHLNDEDAMCLSRVKSYTDQCKTTMDEKRRDLYIENDYDSRERIKCCSVREFRNCLYDTTRRYCQSERTRVVDMVMAGQRHLLTTDSCARVYDYECNAAAALGATHLLALLLLAAAISRWL